MVLHDLLFVVSHIQRIGCQPKKLLYTVANPARAEQGKENKRKSLAAYPPTPHTARSEKINNHATHLQAALRRWSVSRPYKDTFGSSTRPMGVASQNSTLPSAIIRFPVSLLLSSPGDV